MRTGSGFALAVLLALGCGGGGGYAGGNSMPTPVAPAITTQPADVSVPAAQTAQFSVVATGTSPLGYQWQAKGQDIAGATAASYTTAPTAATDDGTGFSVTVSNTAGSVKSNTVHLTVTVAAAATDVLTYHNDSARSGQNLTESALTPATVNSAHFGLLRTLAVDGLVDAQPLVVTNLTVSGQARKVLFVVTEHGSIYTFDADDGTPLVHRSLLGTGETTSDSHGCGQVFPEIGITSTPVIDRGVGAQGTLYAVAMSKDAGGHYIQRLHALDLVTLAEQSGSPVVITGTYPGTGSASSGGTVTFDPGQYKERVGLLLLNGIVYTAWASHCDVQPYTGWIMGFDQSTLAQTRILNVVPNGGLGAIWQSGGGMAADPQGNVYALVGNGTFDTTFDAGGLPAHKNYGNSFVKITTANPLAVTDYFAMNNVASENAADVDLGSGAPMVLPDQQDSNGTVRHLAVGAGKDGHLYLVDRDNMGKFMSGSNAIWQDLTHVLPGGIWSAPAYFHGKVYFADVNGTLKAFVLSQAKLSSAPAAVTGNVFGFPGASPSVSANGTSGGIVWAVESTKSQPAVLHAYDAENVATELYNSNQAAAGRDHFGNGNKFITPTIANGKVYVGTPKSVAVFGLNP